MNTRRLYLNEDEGHAVERAVHLIRALHSIEQLHTISPEDDEGLWHLLGGVDPIEMTWVVDQLETVSRRYQHAPIMIGGVRDG